MSFVYYGTNAIPEVLKAFEDVIPKPATYCHVKCSHKVYSTSSCYACWHCPKCGAHGCDNLARMKPDDTLIEVVCEFDGKEP